jgi:hypothetical protein
LNPLAVAKTNMMQTVIRAGVQDLETIQKSLSKQKRPQRIRSC